MPRRKQQKFLNLYRQYQHPKRGEKNPSDCALSLDDCPPPPAPVRIRDIEGCPLGKGMKKQPHYYFLYPFQPPPLLQPADDPTSIPFLCLVEIPGATCFVQRNRFNLQTVIPSSIGNVSKLIDLIGLLVKSRFCFQIDAFHCTSASLALPKIELTSFLCKFGHLVKGEEEGGRRERGRLCVYVEDVIGPVRYVYTHTWLEAKHKRDQFCLFSSLFGGSKEEHLSASGQKG